MAQPDGQSPAAHTNPAPAQPDAAADSAAPTRSGRLLGLVRKLIDYGKQLLTTLQQPGAAERVFQITSVTFGTLEIPLIIARITRGLMRAAALEQRVTENAARIDKPQADAPARSASAAKPRPRPRKQSKLSPADTARALLARMPTEQEIAEEVRRRPIGEVIIDICSDLGIAGDHPLWQEIQNAVMENGGNVVHLIDDMFHRCNPANFLTREEMQRPWTAEDRRMLYELAGCTPPPPPRAAGVATGPP